MTVYEAATALKLWTEGRNTFDIAKELRLRGSRNISEGKVFDFITAHVCSKAQKAAELRKERA